MAENSKISWTNHTFNPWWGCVKVSEGCKNCYAETFSKRIGNDVWGVDKPRRFFGDKHWNQPLKWNKKAKESDSKDLVFCASMADVFEDRIDLVESRDRLFSLIDATPNLIWLLLTKRPENIRKLWPFGWYDNQFTWTNIWIGTTIESQWQMERLSYIADIPAAIRFVSVEPMLGPLTIRPLENMADWFICGGESGARSRPFKIEWARDLLKQCQEENVPFFMKQLGGHPDKRDRIDEWPEDLRVQEFPA